VWQFLFLKKGTLSSPCYFLLRGLQTIKVVKLGLKEGRENDPFIYIQSLSKSTSLTIFERDIFSSSSGERLTTLGSATLTKPVYLGCLSKDRKGLFRTELVANTVSSAWGFNYQCPVNDETFPICISGFAYLKNIFV